MLYKITISSKLNQFLNDVKSLTKGQTDILAQFLPNKSLTSFSQFFIRLDPRKNPRPVLGLNFFICSNAYRFGWFREHFCPARFFCHLQFLLVFVTIHSRSDVINGEVRVLVEGSCERGFVQTRF